jgi:pantoate--beta-alanine ligase
VRRVTTIDEVRAAVADHRAKGATIGLVPTMGSLHEGHLSLVAEARRHADVVVVSIFVNPTQFGEGEDLDAYPRDLEGDERALRTLGDAAPDLVFAPTAEEVYPRGTPLTRVLVDGLTERLCGASRPGHFDGVGLVVTKLHDIVQPDVAVYGRKDFQQLQIVRRIVADLDQPVRVVGAPLVREPDGLAMSSRNRYLDDDQRRAAVVLSRALRAAVVAARDVRAAGGTPTPGMLRDAASVTLSDTPDVHLDYLEVLDPETLQPPASPLDAQRGEEDAGPSGDAHGPGTWLVALAAFVGPARLIDNVVIGDTDDEDRLLAATEDQ